MVVTLQPFFQLFLKFPPHEVVLMKCPSCIAANVATAATIEMGTMDTIVMGTARKSRNPAHLFARV